jgi:hypothetical protein
MIPTVSLPIYSEQFLALIDLLDSLQAQTNTPPSAGTETGTGADVLPLKGIIFVEQVAMTYPLAKMINNIYSSRDPLKAMIGKNDPVALPVCGSDMSDTVR